MLKRIKLFKIVSVLLLIVFVHEQLGWTQDGAPVWADLENVSNIPSGELPSEIKIPYDIGEVCDATTSGTSEVIINIQDAHASLSSQHSIVNILDNLVSNYDVKFIALEGSEGYIDTSILRTFPNKNIRRETAEYLMREGRLSAGEFFDATRDEKDIILYGVEDNELYNKNVQSFKEIIDERALHTQEVEALKKQLEALSEKVFSPELKTLLEKSRLHRKGTLSFSDYWKEIKDIASAGRVSHGDLKNVEKLLRSIEMEEKINFAKANLERKQLIGVLSDMMDREDIEELVLRSLLFKQNKISQADFHSHITRLATSYGIDTTEYEHLVRFIEYVSLYESIDIMTLFKEISDLETRMKEALYRNSDERELAEWIKLVGLIGNLYNVELSNDDCAYIIERQKDCNGSSCASFIKRISLKYNAQIASGYDTGLIFGGVEDALEFYRVAESRNNALLKNTLSCMRAEGKQVAALITGGFHTNGLTQLMRDNKLSYLVIAPKFEKGKERPYIAVLTNKKKPYQKLIDTGKYQLAVKAYFEDMDEDRFVGAAIYALSNVVKDGGNWRYEAERWYRQYKEEYDQLKTESEDRVEGSLSPEEFARILGVGDFEGQGQLRIESWDGTVMVARVKDDESTYFRLDRGEGGVLESPRVLSPRQGRKILAALDHAKTKREKAGRVRKRARIERDLAEVLETQVAEARYFELAERLRTDKDLLYKFADRFKYSEDVKYEEVATKLKAAADIDLPGDWEGNDQLRGSVEEFARSVNGTVARIKVIKQKLRSDEKLVKFVARFFLSTNQDLTAGNVADFLKDDLKEPLLEAWQRIPELSTSIQDFTRWVGNVTPTVMAEIRRHHRWNGADLERYESTLSILNMLFKHLGFDEGEDSIEEFIDEMEGSEERPVRVLEVGSGVEHPITDYFRGKVRAKIIGSQGDGQNFKTVYEKGFPHVRAEALDPRLRDAPEEGMYRGNALKMDMFDDASFDHIFAFQVFNPECYAHYGTLNEEFWEDNFPGVIMSEEKYYKKIADEFLRIMKPGGKIFMSTGMSHNDLFNRILREAGFECEYLGYHIGFQVFTKPSGEEMSLEKRRKLTKRTLSRIAKYLDSCITSIRNALDELPVEGGELNEDQLVALEKLMMLGQNIVEEFRGDDLYVPYMVEVKNVLGRETPGSTFCVPQAVTALYSVTQLVMIRGNMGKNDYLWFANDLAKLRRMRDLLHNIAAEDITFFYSPSHQANYVNLRNWEKNPPLHSKEWKSYLFCVNREDILSKVEWSREALDAFDKYIPSVNVFNEMVRSGEITVELGEEEMFERVEGFMFETDPETIREIGSFARLKAAQRYMDKRGASERKGPGGPSFGFSLLFSIFVSGVLTALMQGTAFAASSTGDASGGMFLSTGTVLILVAFVMGAVTVTYLSGLAGRYSKRQPFKRSLLRSSVIGMIAFTIFFFTFNIAEMRFPRSIKDLFRTPVVNAKQVVNGFLSEKPKEEIADGLEHSLVSVNGIPAEVMWADSSAKMEMVPYSKLKGYVPPKGYKVYGVFNTAPQNKGKHTTLVGANGKVFRARNKVSTRAGGAFYVRYPNGKVRIIRNTDEAYEKYIAGKPFEVAVQAGPLVKEAGKVSDNLPKEATSRLYVGVDPVTNRTKIIHVGSGMTGYSNVREVLEEHFKDFPEVMLFDAGQFDISRMGREGVSGKVLDGDNVFCLVVMAKALSVRSPFAEPEWKKTPLYTAVLSGVLGIVAQFAFSDNIAAFAMIGLAFITSSYAVGFTAWKYGILREIRLGRFQSEEYWDAPNPVVRERVMTIFGELSRVLVGGHVNHKHARKLVGSKIDVSKGPSEVVLVGEESEEAKEILGDNYAVFDKGKNVLYVLGTLARAPDWVLATILTHEVAHHFTKREFRANLFAAYNFRKALRAVRDLSYTKEDYRIATVTKNRETREQSLRKSRLAVLIAERMKKEGYAITDEDIELLKKVFLAHAAGGSDGEYSLEVLDEEGVILPEAGRELIRYYHSFAAFNNHLKYAIARNPDSVETLLDVKRLLPIVRLVDQFEEDQDRMGMMVTSVTPETTFHHTFKILQDVFDEEGIVDRSAFSVFRSMMGEADPRVLNLIAEARRTNILTVSDHVLMEISTVKEKKFALSKGLHRDPGKDEHAVMMFTMALPEKLKKRVVHYLEENGFDVARGTRKRGRIGMDNVLRFWGTGGVIEDSVNELSKEGFGVFLAKVAIVQNDGKAFEEWFQRIEDKDPKHPAVKKLRYWINTLNRGVETVIVRSRVSKRKLMEQFNAPESALDVPFQDFFSGYVVGHENVFRAELGTLRREFIEPELQAKGQLKKVFKAGGKALLLTDVGLANGINCPSYEKLQNNTGGYTELKWKKTKKTSPAAISSLKEMLFPGMPLKSYSLKVAPWIEEGLFYLIPFVTGFITFGIESIWTVIIVAATRAAFFFLHKKPRDLMSMTQEEIFELFNPSYGQLRKHVYADLKYVVALAKAMGIEEGSEDMHMLRVIALTHDLGGVLGLKNDEEIEKNLMMLAMDKKVQYEGRDQNDVEADLIGRQAFLTADDKNFIPVMDHPNNSLRILDSYGINVPPMVRKIISRHMSSPTEKEFKSWTERERRLFTCFTIADVFETGNNYYKQKGGYYKHESKFEEPEKTIDFIKSTKFRDRPSIEGYVSAAEEFIFAGGIDEAIKFSRTPIDKADMSMEIIPRAPPKKRIIPAVVAIAGALLPVMPLVSPGFQSVPAVFILISALVIASTHFILNILAFILEWIPASIVEEGKEGEGESSDAAAPVFVTEAASMLASEDEAVRVDAIKRLGNSGSPYAIAPLVKFLGTLNQSGASDDPRVKIAVIEQLARLKKVSLKVRGSREAGSSIMGIINSSLDELSIPRESVNIYGPYERMKIKFDLPVSPTGKIARLNSVLREKFVASHIAVNITRPERNALELSFDLTVENLTAFWRALGTVDLKVDEENNYRKFTDVEMMKKIEERTRMLLGGMEEGSDEYRALHFFVYGDGTNANPGLLNIMSHPEKIRTISEEEYEQRYEAGRRESQLVKMVDDRRVVTYGDAQLLRVESVTTRKHNPDYCSYNDLFTMSMSNPYFSHYLENVSGEEFGDVGGIKRWVYLARAAGSVFQTSYMTDIMRGKESNDYMFFISQDTIAPYNRYGSTLDMLVSDTDRADDMDFEGLKAYILSDLNKKYTEGKERWREVLDAIWLQLENSFILEGVKPGEHIMAVDEIANGTYDFMLKYIVEKKTLERTLEEKGTTLEAETKNIIDEEGLEAEAAEKEARRRNQVNVEIFIGKARTAIIEGYPELQIKRIMEDFGISRERADEIIESVSTVADFIPHPIKIGLDENTQPPFLGGDLPIQLEESDVLIASYLKALITINGLIDYHEKVVFYPLANLLVNDRNPEVRKAAASALAELGLSAKAKEVLVKVAADEIDSSVRSEISAALIKILTGELNDAIEVDEAGEVKVRSMKKLLEKINLVIEATDYPYAKTREFASSILAAVSGDMSAGVDRKMNALPVDSAQMAKAAREHSFVVPSVNIGLGKVTLLFQAQAVLEAARDKHAAVGIALSHDEFENFDYRNEPSPVDRVADIAEKVYNGEESMYFYHLESPKITEYTPAEMNRVKRIITMAMEQGYTSVSTDCSRLYIEGRILSEEKDWDDQYKEIGVFRNISIRKEGNDIIEEFEVMGKGKSIAGDYEPVGKMVLRNGKIIQVPKLWQEGYFNYTPENIMIDKTMSIEERLRDVIKASADIYEHIQQECRRLGIKVGREATIGEVDSGLSILDSATGQTVKALTTPEEVSVFLNGVTSRINARLRGKQEIHKPYDLVAINNGLLHGYRFDENDRLIAQSANSIDLKLTSSVASSLQTAITQHGFSGTDYRSGKDIPKSGISKININTDLQAIVWKVLETYEPGTFRKVFDKARERAVSLGEEYVTDDAEYDYAHAKNRIIYGHAKKVIVSAGKENDYTLINEIKNAIQNSNKRMIIDGDAPGRISASYVVHDIQFTEDNEKGNSAVWMIRDLTRRKMTEVLEELGCTGSADKIPRRGQRRLLGSQIADLLHRESVFSMIGTTDFVQGTKDVVRKLAEAYEENIDADRPTVGVLLGAVSSGKRTMAKSIRRNMRGYESKTGKKCNVRYFWSESGWMFGYSRREDPSIFGRFDLKGSLGFRSFMRRIREGKDAYVPFFDQGKRRRFRVADPSPYASSNGDVDEERFTQVVRDRIERLKTAGAEEVMVREAVLLRLFNENGEWLVRDSRLQEEIEEGFRLIEEHGNWERDIVRKNLYIDITERKNGQFVSGDIVERIMPSGNDIFIVSSRIVGSDEVFLPEEREELFDVSVGMWAPPEVRKLKLLRRLRSEVLYSLTPENVTLASFDMKLTTEEMKWIDPTLRGADMVLLNINNFEKFLFSEKVQETFTEQLIAGMYVMLSERYNVLDGQELFASEKSKLEKIIFSYGRVIDGELMTDDRLLARMKKEILEPGVPDKRLITEHMMTIGIPAGMFGELSENDIRTLESIHDARVVILESLTKEGMLDELEQARRRYRCASSVLVDADAGTEHLARLIVKFAEEMKDRVFVLAHPEVEEFSPETISKIDNLPFLLEEISSKYLDVLGSLELGSMSVYQMRVENSYRTVEGNFRVDYKPAAINEKDDHYLLHYAEGEKILDAAHGAIVPAGLEIARRRERMKVTIDTDRQRDRFMVMAPENVVTETEKAEFKERLIELWMLDGLVKGEDIVILDWKEEGYTNSDLFGMTQSVASEANVQNTGIRVISGDLGYSNKALLQVNLSSKAANNLNQYEVFVNLLLTGKPGRLTGLAKLDLTEGRLFIYLPKARPIDFENEVRNYYEKYREVLIRA